MKIELRTLTPIFTGNIDGNSNTLQPTSIIGSLRWWTEAILRGLGYYACDPTNENQRCPPYEKHGDNEYREYCHACSIFGNDGLQRTFKLAIFGGKPLFEDNLNNLTLNIKPNGRNRGWFLKSGIIGDINLRITKLNNDFNNNLLLPLVIASRRGAIGAKTQLGYGVIVLNNINDIDIDKFCSVVDNLIERVNKRRKFDKNVLDVLPNLKNMFFTKIRFQLKNNQWYKLTKLTTDNNFILNKLIQNNVFPIAPIIKNWLRYGNGRDLWYNKQNERVIKNIENWLFGSTKRLCRYCFNSVNRNRYKKDNFWCKNCKNLQREETFERMAAKIYISSAYKVDDEWEIRIWGCIDNMNGFNKDDFLYKLKASLDKGCIWKNLDYKINNNRIVEWREFDSDRDSTKRYGDIKEYINSLINGVRMT